MIDVAEAQRLVLGAVPGPLPAEAVALDASDGRVIAEDVAAAEDLPPFAASAMDGYAVRSGPEAELEVVGESRAGAPADAAVGPRQAIAISTGAAMPAGADAVVPVERTEPAAAERVRVGAAEPGANVRGAGEDMRAGEVVIPSGTDLGPAEVAVLASVGRAEARCARRPRVAVLTTGDELVEPGAALGPGQIRNSNGYALAAQARAAGAEVVMRALVPDDHEATRAALADAIDAAEVVCVSGGVSVGEHDHVKAALAELGAEEIFWRVRLKPGKPTWFGRRGETLVFGLPGNPVSAMVTFHLFAQPALRVMLGADPAQPATAAVAGEAFPRDPKRDQAVRCTLTADEGGWRAVSTGAQNSHILTSMLGARALALVGAGEGEIAPGERLAVMLLP